MVDEKKYNIAFLSHVPYIGGAEISTLLLLKYLDRNIFNLFYIMPSKGSLYERVISLNVQCVIMPLEKIALPLPIGYVRTVWNLSKFIFLYKIDLVICTVEICNQYGLPAARLNRIPIICHTRGMVSDFRSFWRTFLHFPDMLIANSKATAESYERFLRRSQKVEVVYNGVDLNEFLPSYDDSNYRKKYSIPDNSFVVGMVGRISRPKRQHILIQAIAEITESHNVIYAFIVGNTDIDKSQDYLTELHQLVKDNGLEKHIFFIDFIKDMKPFYSAIDVLVLPSRAEPFGRVVIEAMAMKKPVIATRAGGVVEIIEDNVSGFFVPPDDVHALAQSIITVKSKLVDIGALCNKAHETVINKFSIDKNVLLTQSIYLNALYQTNKRNMSALIKIIVILLRNPFNFIFVLQDVFRFYSSLQSNAVHIKSAIDWLCYAQDISGNGGVSAGFSLVYGWQASHRETTGYIIPSFFDFADYSGNKEYFERAIQMADWELSVQLPEGGIPYGTEINNKQPLVFDTGQVLFGWVRAYKETGNTKYLNAAVLAGKWIRSLQESDGSWVRFSYNDFPHSYYTRVDWALLELYELTKDEQFKSAAIKNIEWVLSNQLDNGWFNYCTFLKNEFPLTHTLAYTVEGILESGIILNNQRYIDKAKKTANALIAVQNADGSLHGVYDSGWKGAVSWSCLTGNAQMAVIWFRIYQITSDVLYYNTAVKAVSYLKMLQNITTFNKNVKGAVKGSHPIWGGYNSFNYINWAAKFFIDALLLEERCRHA